MKTCLVCTQANADDALTCPLCGEASWGASADASPAVEPQPEPVADGDAAVPSNRAARRAAKAAS